MLWWASRGAGLLRARSSSRGWPQQEDRPFRQLFQRPRSLKELVRGAISLEHLSNSRALEAHGCRASTCASASFSQSFKARARRTMASSSFSAILGSKGFQRKAFKGPRGPSLVAHPWPPYVNPHPHPPGAAPRTRAVRRTPPRSSPPSPTGFESPNGACTDLRQV